jgi:hypothetical protein
MAPFFAALLGLPVLFGVFLGLNEALIERIPIWVYMMLLGVWLVFVGAAATVSTFTYLRWVPLVRR